MKNGKRTSLKTLKNYGLAGMFILILVFLDQWTKYLAVLYLKGNMPIVILEQVFELSYLENRGAAFGIFQNQRWVFLVLTSLIMAILIFVYFRIPFTRRYLPLRICLVVSFAGAAGNMIDRILQGYVVDFFYFKLIDFPVFNVADIYVTVSVGIAVLLLLFYYSEEEMQEVIQK